MSRRALILAAVALVVFRIHEKIERYLEHFGNFTRVGFDIKGRRHDANDRHYGKTGARPVIGKPADDLDVAPMNADLLFRFAKCRFLGRDVAPFDMAARKADLSRVMRQIIGALGQQHGHAVPTCYHGDQHRCRGQDFWRSYAGIEIVVAVAYAPVAAGLKSFDDPVWLQFLTRARLVAFDGVAKFMEDAAAPHPKYLRLFDLFFNAQRHQIVKGRPIELRF